MAETLARCGVDRAVVSPGSRSTPLTMALVANPVIEAIPVLDERSAAFFALGLAKQRRSPTVLVCTSGTAGANYFPAVIEAHESGVPLIVITADRPPEMRECASGQTIDQLRLFGAHVAWFHELAVPEPSLSLLRYLRQTVAHACERSAAGPVHLNAPFRDPLAPVEDASAKALESSLDVPFFAHLRKAEAPASATVFLQRPTTARGVIVAGPESPPDPKNYAETIVRLAEGLQWPILADALSPVRRYAPRNDYVVAAYDAILRSTAVARHLCPKSVLCLGGWPTSKVLRSWIDESGAEIALVSPRCENRDALHGRTRHISASAEQLAAAGEGIGDGSYLLDWRRCEERAQSVFERELKTDERVEPRIARELAALLPAGTPLFVASSMPIRDVEYVWPVTSNGVQLHFSRGANGIDGTLSTALGVAHGGAPAVLLTGDLALLHDTNGFLLRSKLRGSLTVVLVNNRGGGIFQHLPVAQFDPPFEEYFATPQDVDFSKLCSAYGVQHVAIATWEQFAEALGQLPQTGIRVLEIRTDRKRDVAFRKSLFAKAAAEAEQGLGDQR